LVYEKFKKKDYLSMHPRTRSKIKEMAFSKGIRIIDPLGFYDLIISA